MQKNKEKIYKKKKKKNLLYRPKISKTNANSPALNLYLQKIGLKKVIGRLSTLKTLMLTNVMEEDDPSSCLKILSWYTVIRRRKSNGRDSRRFA